MFRPSFIAVALASVLGAFPAAAQAHRGDRNHDRIPDRWEQRHGLSLRVNQARRDTDRDRLTNLREYRLHTDPRRRDTDRDGILDGRDRYPLRAFRRAAPRPSTPEPSASAAQAGTRAPGAAVLSDSEAAGHVTRSGWEPRPGNARPNHTVPSAAALGLFQAASPSWGACDTLKRHITGNFTGTTDELIQWTAWKWGIDANVIRAEAIVESNWDQLGQPGDGGISFGLMQIKSTVSRGTLPLSSSSTAFNLDYYGATIRYYFDGCADWLRSTAGGERYGPGDLWGSLGAWFAGRWHNDGASNYIAKVQAKLNARAWAQPGF
jgi:autotransporter family porin